MPFPTEQRVPYSDEIRAEFDWYQTLGSSGGTRPWLLITNTEGFRGGGLVAARTGGRAFSNFIDFFVSGSRTIPFDVFVSQGPQHDYIGSSVEAPELQEELWSSVHFPDNIIFHGRAFQYIKTLIRAGRIPGLDVDSGGLCGYSSGGTVAQWLSFGPSLNIHSGLGYQRYVYGESSKPAFLVNWSGANDYRDGAFFGGSVGEGYSDNLFNNEAYFGVPNAQAELIYMQPKLASAASPQTLIDATAPPTYNIYDNEGFDTDTMTTVPSNDSRPAVYAHDRIQGQEVHAALQAVGVESVYQTKPGDQGTTTVLTNGELTAIYNWIIGPTVLDL
jgi:hypothetical protein